MKPINHSEIGTDTLRRTITTRRTQSAILALDLLSNPEGLPVEDYETDHGEGSARTDMSLLNNQPLLETAYRIDRIREMMMLTLRKTGEQVVLTPPPLKESREELRDQLIHQGAFLDNLRKIIEERSERLEAMFHSTKEHRKPETPIPPDQSIDHLKRIITSTQTQSARLALALLANPRGVLAEEYETNHGKGSARTDMVRLNHSYLQNTDFRIVRDKIRNMIALTLRKTGEQVVLTPPPLKGSKKNLFNQLVHQSAFLDTLRRTERAELEILRTIIRAYQKMGPT